MDGKITTQHQLVSSLWNDSWSVVGALHIVAEAPWTLPCHRGDLDSEGRRLGQKGAWRDFARSVLRDRNILDSTARQDWLAVGTVDHGERRPVVEDDVAVAFLYKTRLKHLPNVLELFSIQKKEVLYWEQLLLLVL